MKQEIKPHEFCEQWLANGIGDDYKNWKDKASQPNFYSASRIFIESPTGTGKTSFIFEKLLPYAAQQQKNILYLGNRTALQEQNEYIHQMKSGMIPFQKKWSHFLRGNWFWYRDSGAVITLMNYQAFPAFIKRCRQQFQYIILDEAHFFLEDALFNPMTGMILCDILRHYTNAILIMMSATMSDTIELFKTAFYLNRPSHPLQEIRDHFHHEEIIFYKNIISRNRYRVSFYSKSTELVHKIAGTPEEEKWLIFVSSRQKGTELKRMLENRAGHSISVTFLTANSKKTAAWKTLIEQASFDKRILIATKVLDNGVNIQDERVKHIVLPFCNWIDFKQMLGRLRLKPDQVINVYVLNPTVQQIQTQLHQIRHKLRVMEPFIGGKPMPPY